MSRGDDRDEPDSTGVRILIAVSAAVGIVAGNIADGLPRTPLAWTALVGTRASAKSSAV